VAAVVCKSARRALCDARDVRDVHGRRCVVLVTRCGPGVAGDGGESECPEIDRKAVRCRKSAGNRRVSGQMSLRKAMRRTGRTGLPAGLSYACRIRIGDNHVMSSRSPPATSHRACSRAVSS
jgi:hypothetical protein